MGSVMNAVFLAVPLFAPFVLIYGWFRWFKGQKQKTPTATLALIGFILASSSALLAIVSIVLSLIRGGFRYYDPTLMEIFRAGLLISLGSLVCSLGGVWKPSSLRWFAPVLSICMLTLWMLWAGGE
jgi:hypothetical protein